MSIKVTFRNNTVVVYPEGREVLSSATEQLLCVLSTDGTTLATLPTADVEKFETVDE